MVIARMNSMSGRSRPVAAIQTSQALSQLLTVQRSLNKANPTKIEWEKIEAHWTTNCA